MNASPLFTVENVTPAEFQQLRINAANEHLDFSGVAGSDSGMVSGHGVILTYVYNEAAESIIVTIKEKPFYVPQDLVESKVRDWCVLPYGSSEVLVSGPGSGPSTDPMVNQYKLDGGWKPAPPKA